jgi:flagellar biosynthesis protein FliQ
MYTYNTSLYAHVNVWGWILAGLSAMVVGMIWYSPFLFGKRWTAATGVAEKEMNSMRPKVLPVLVVVSLLTAYVLSLFTVYLHSYMGNSWMTAALDTAFLAWLGLAGTAVVAHEIWDKKGRDAMYINLGNRLVTLVVMGLIIGALINK